MTQISHSQRRSLLGRSTLSEWRPEPHDATTMYFTLPTGAAGLRLSVLDTLERTINEARQLLTFGIENGADKLPPAQVLLALINYVEAAPLTSCEITFELYPVLRIGHPRLTLAQALNHPDPDTLPSPVGSISASFPVTVEGAGLTIGPGPTVLLQSQSESDPSFEDVPPQLNEGLSTLATFAAYKLNGDCGRLLRHWIPGALLHANRQQLVSFLQQELQNLTIHLSRQMLGDVTDVLDGLSQHYNSMALFAPRQQSIDLTALVSTVISVAEQITADR